VCSDTCESRATTCCASTSASRHRDMLPCARAQSMPAQTPTHARAHTHMHTCYFRHASWCSLQMCVLRHTHTHMHTHVRIHSLFWILNTTCSSAKLLYNVLISQVHTLALNVLTIIHACTDTSAHMYTHIDTDTDIHTAIHTHTHKCKSIRTNLQIVSGRAGSADGVSS